MVGFGIRTPIRGGLVRAPTVLIMNHDSLSLREAAKKKTFFFGKSFPNVGGWGG